MSEMVERVALALIRSLVIGDGSDPGDDAEIAETWADVNMRAAAMRDARAAIETMRKPTRAMEDASATWGHRQPELAMQRHYNEVYRIMIDAALTSSP